jgi:hypothetical protein
MRADGIVPANCTDRVWAIGRGIETGVGAVKPARGLGSLLSGTQTEAT